MSLPSNWTDLALSALATPADDTTRAIMRAWRKSTPLPEFVLNPIGMPAGSRGAAAYLGTGYAIFPSMTAFLVALAAFADTYQGQRLSAAISGESPYPGAWRAINALGWPGGITETDYPSAVLDLAETAYRESVGATPSDERKTSGMALPRNSGIAPSTEGQYAASQAVRSLAAAIGITAGKMRG